jgi:hypothetical protein
MSILSPASSHVTPDFGVSGSSRENVSSLLTPPQERRDLGFSLPPPQDPEPPRDTYRQSVALQRVVPSPRVLPWNAHARGNDGGSPTPPPPPRYLQPSRIEPPRLYETSMGPDQPVQHSYSILEPPRPTIPMPPQERRDPGFSLPPPQQPKPLQGTYRHAMRHGYWNRRGDYLTMDDYVVYAPHNRANPPELEGYPLPTEGYEDHHGNFIRYDPSRKELPESLPWQGQPPLSPYDRVSRLLRHPSLFFFSDEV